MPTFDLDDNHAASYVAYRHGRSYVAKGTVFHKGKPVEIFEAHGPTLAATDQAARAKARESLRRWRVKGKTFAPKKR